MGWRRSFFDKYDKISILKGILVSQAPGCICVRIVMPSNQNIIWLLKSDSASKIKLIGNSQVFMFIKGGIIGIGLAVKG